MTMPHLMNCEHADEGWCLGCVRELWDEKELAQTHVAALKKDIEDLIYLDGEAAHGASEMQQKNERLLIRLKALNTRHTKTKDALETLINAVKRTVNLDDCGHAGGVSLILVDAITTASEAMGETAATKT